MTEAEKYLDSIRDVAFKIKTLERMRAETREQIGMIKKKQNEGHHELRHDALENDIIKSISKLEKLDRGIVKERTEYMLKKKEAYEYIMRLKEGQCRRFLIDYYIEGKSEIDIAYEYRYESTVSIYNLKRRALNYFSEMF